VRRAWRKITNPICRQAVEVAEQYADQRVKNAAREQANRAVRALCKPGVAANVSIASHVSRGGRYTHVSAGIVAQRAVFVVTGVPQRGDTPAEGAERAAQCQLFRDIFGNPFRPVDLDRHWKTATVVAVAQSIYDDRAFDRLPILADALEDAGCDNLDILQHCHSGGEHVRGCWVVDLILGKE
jgi:hypothetical protein